MGTRVCQRISFDMGDGGQALGNLRHPPRRKNEGIAAGQDHFPDFRMGRDIGQRLFEILGREGIGFAGPDAFAAETEAAIDRAGRHRLEQNPVGMAMDNAGDGRMGGIANGIGELFRQGIQFLQRRQELTRNGIVGIERIQQRQQMRRHRHRIFALNLCKIGWRDLFQIAWRQRHRFCALKLGRKAASKPIAGRKAQIL